MSNSNSTIRFEGLEEILERFEQVASVDNVQKALGQACAVVERSAKQKAPKGTSGDLRKLISSRVDGLEGIVFCPLEYAPYVEYGTGLFAEDGGRTDVPWHYQDEKGEWHSTSGMKPQPFMRPALDENRENILAIMREGITND